MSAPKPDPTAPSSIEIGLPVASLPPMRHFYASILGLEPAGRTSLNGTQIEAFRFGNSVLKLSYFAQAEVRPEPHPVEFKNGYLTLRVTDAEATVNRCESEGVRVVRPLGEAVMGSGKRVKFAFVGDPMGNAIEIVEGDAWS
ncbi:hypothetical protein G7Y89_g13812 [Cudoniella acicularis]|uniref:VOC domain-containing protein n=1 Tax=Cudoniella acicularis TaxID=354080 RepID=A0A8H4VW25_9HELO|nr:hypothetical protein G7Y89_g13812 [Cudoniella acicularis]